MSFQGRALLSWLQLDGGAVISLDFSASSIIDDASNLNQRLLGVKL
jgi:hypothetical protein